VIQNEDTGNIGYYIFKAACLQMSWNILRKLMLRKKG
jgi:hypothetical protein